MIIQILPHQHEFLTSKAKESLLLGGIGSGKSVSGAQFVVNMVANYPKSKGLIVANTFSQLMNATVVALSAELERLNIPYELVQSGASKRFEIFGITIYLYSLEKYDNIRGIEVGWIWGDEVCFAKDEAINVIKGRLRDKNGPLYERWTSSPNGFNTWYEKFEGMDGDRKTDRYHLVRAKTAENIFLPPSYYETLLEDYGGENNPLAKQELMGEFVNMAAGSIYWAFDRGKHVDNVKLDKRFPVYVGQDFNIDNMCSVYIQRIDGEYQIAKELVLNQYGANTDNAGSTIRKELAGYEVYVVPDSTGKARKTSSKGMSDIQILESYGLNVVPTVNPFIRDRQNTLNILFKKNKIKIDPSCKTLIKELETLNARDKEGDKAHVSVSLGYVTYKYDRLKRDRRSTVTQL